jgi:hypothetical protein
MNHLFNTLGWCFSGTATVFLFGLLNPLARRFYPENPDIFRRAAAPVIFALLSVACFTGAGMQAMILLVLAGTIQIVIDRRNRRGPRKGTPSSRPLRMVPVPRA